MVLRTFILILLFMAGPDGWSQQEDIALNQPYDQPLVSFELNKAYWQGHYIHLTPSETRVLYALLNNRGLAIDYEKLLELRDGFNTPFIGNPDNPYARVNNISASIKRLNKKFKAVDPHFDRIENYKNFGYRWRLDFTPMPNAEELIILGDLALHPKSYTVFWKNQIVRDISALSFPVIKKLALRKAHGMACAEVLREREASYGGSDDNHLASIHMSKIKSAFLKKDPSFNCIKSTTIDAGYYWACR